MIYLGNVLPFVDLLPGANSNITIKDLANNNSALISETTVEVPRGSSLGFHTVMSLGTEVTPKHTIHRTGNPRKKELSQKPEI